MQLLPLTRGLVALVDDKDWARVSEIKWYARPADQARPNWYVTTTINGRTTYLHRFILGVEADVHVDHINGDGLDNRRANIRPATRVLNNANSIRPRSASGFRGVYAHNGRYRAMISVGADRSGRRCIHLGMFDTADVAALAYDRAASERFGPFAKLNFPGGQS